TTGITSTSAPRPNGRTADYSALGQQVSRPGRRAASQVVRDLALECARAIFRRGIDSAAEQAGIELSSERAAPQRRCDPRIVAGIREKMDAEPVGFGFGFGVELPVAAELRAESLAHTRTRKPVAMMQHAVGQFVGEDSGDLFVGRALHQVEPDLNDPTVRSSRPSIVYQDFDQRPALHPGNELDLSRLSRLDHRQAQW